MSPSDRSQEKICYRTYTGVTNYRKNMNHDPDGAGIGRLCYSLSGMLLWDYFSLRRVTSSQYKVALSDLLFNQ